MDFGIGMLEWVCLLALARSGLRQMIWRKMLNQSRTIWRSVRNFADRLQEAIRKSGKPKGDLARHCGVALSTVSRWLAGTVPRMDMLRKIAGFLAVDETWLLIGRSSADSEVADPSLYTLRDESVLRETPNRDDPPPGIWEALRMIKTEVSPHVADEVEKLLLEHQRVRLRAEADDFFGNIEALAASANEAAAVIGDERIADDLRTISEAVAKLMPTVQTLVQSLTKPKP